MQSIGKHISHLQICTISEPAIDTLIQVYYMTNQCLFYMFLHKLCCILQVKLIL